MSEVYDPEGWIRLGQSLGYKDGELQNYVKDQERKHFEYMRTAEERETRQREREERTAQREYELAKIREETRQLELRAQVGNQPEGRPAAQNAPRPKLPRFDGA